MGNDCVLTRRKLKVKKNDLFVKCALAFIKFQYVGVSYFTDRRLKAEEKLMCYMCTILLVLKPTLITHRDQKSDRFFSASIKILQ